MTVTILSKSCSHGQIFDQQCRRSNLIPYHITCHSSSRSVFAPIRVFYVKNVIKLLNLNTNYIFERVSQKKLNVYSIRRQREMIQGL